MGRKPVNKHRTRDPRKRQKYLNQLRPLFFEHGLTALSVDDLSERLGVSKGTLYNSFSSKEEIVAVLMEQVLREIGGFEAIVDDRSKPFMDRYLESIELLTRSLAGMSNRFLSDLKDQYPALWEQVRRFREYATQVLVRFYEEGKATGVIGDVSTRMLVLSDRLFFDALTEPAVLEANGLSLQEAFSEYFRLKVTGMLSDSPDGDVKRLAINMLESANI